MDYYFIFEVVISIIILLWISRSVYYSRYKQDSLLTNSIVWLLIFVILIIIYAFRFELESLQQRVLSVLIPSYSWTNKQGQLVIGRSQNGHFYVNAKTKNNKTIRFLIDTGATDIAITKEDAKKLGFNPDNLQYNKRYSTANGISYGATIRINQITIGNKTFYNQEAHVTSGNLDVSLLGMSLIDNFRNFKITKDMLILSY